MKPPLVSQFCPLPAGVSAPPDLEALLAADAPAELAAWTARREALRRRWEALLGQPSWPPFARRATVGESVDLPEGTATVYHLPTGPSTRQELVLLRPAKPLATPCPAALVPYYQPAHSVGYDLATRQRLTENPSTQFGRLLAGLGYTVLCLQAYPYNTVADPGGGSLGIWQAAAEALHREHPAWTGMGRLVWDTRLATDFLLAQPGVDPARVLAIGHSLGGKMALYAGALDDRIGAVIVSDLGLGWDHSNWDAPWYLGPLAKDRRHGLAHHQLLAMLAPRPCLLLAGEYDGPQSWPYLAAASAIYALHGQTDALAMLDHASGHQPPLPCITRAMQWLSARWHLSAQA